MHFDPSKDVPRLDGKVILITGGNAGIGAATVNELAAHNPARIFLCTRTTSNANPVVDAAHAAHPDAKIDVLQLDLSSMESVRQCAAEFNAKSDRLDTLLLNAGIAGVAANRSKEGYEIHLGVNHLGHALLTQLLLPKLLQTAQDGSDVRVVVTTSLMAHKSSPGEGIVLNEAFNDNAFGSASQRYGHSKLANILFARKFAQLYPTLTCVSQHPGIVQTEGYSKADGVGVPQFIIRPFLWLTGVSPEKGAYNTLWCATARVEKGVLESGEYYEPVGKHVSRSPHATDQRMADTLWDWTTKELAKHGAPGWPS
ncbi:hypothetical protein LTR37_016275 [Vermiconidia calcicola]|uniref:Uncharacterized protein n=1 Tax=Vermiconidia calcicola TaxID=1690605 RepID=A0ACC3MNL4_9PEZI|nr:hypothetical protein LTR37_016275 [Vermiconidia calcicola]